MVKTMKPTKQAFETDPIDGWTIRAHYTDDPGEAMIEILRDGEVRKAYSYPAYKIWNLAAHADEIIASEIAGDQDGYVVAGSDLLGGGVMPKEIK